MNVSDTRTLETEPTTASQRQPAESETSVVFSGDGEPKTPDSMLLELVAIQQDSGIASDTYTLGGVVEELEQKMAQALGKDAAVFMPTGTLANHLAIRRLCGLKPRAVVQEQCHLYNDTGDCVQQLSGIHMVPLGQDKAFFTMSELEAAVTRSDNGRVSNSVGAIMIESPVRRQGGQVMPLADMQEITDFCRERGIGSHLDGARLYMMSAASGVSPKEYSALFDTVYVSLYKYFGAHFGAILAGTEEFCEGLYNDRRMFGSGLSSSAFAAALAKRGFDGFEERFGVRLYEGYGLSETSPIIAASATEADRPGTVGKPIRNVEVKLVDDDGREIGQGADGEILVRGPGVMKGYYNKPEETAAVLDADGWFKTGDIGRFDADGYLSITGRAKEMLIIGGENVYPREIEAAIEQHEDVVQAAVIGVPDESRGEIPVAFVLKRDGAEVDGSEIRQFVKRLLAGFKVPKKVIIRDELPTGPTGKILKRKLHELL